MILLGLPAVLRRVHGEFIHAIRARERSIR